MQGLFMPLGLLQKMPFDFSEVFGELFKIVAFLLFFSAGPILKRIFGGGSGNQKDAEKELEKRRKRAEILRRQAEERAQSAASRGPTETGTPPVASAQTASPPAQSTESWNPFGPEEELDRSWADLSENAAERESAESRIERLGPDPVGPPPGERELGGLRTSDITSIDDLAPLATLSEANFESLASEFETRTEDSLLLPGTAAQRRGKGVSPTSLRGAWRQAIVLREVLGTPVGMRSDREDLPGLR